MYRLNLFMCWTQVSEFRPPNLVPDRIFPNMKAKNRNVGNQIPKNKQKTKQMFEIHSSSSSGQKTFQSQFNGQMNHQDTPNSMTSLFCYLFIFGQIVGEVFDQGAWAPNCGVQFHWDTKYIVQFERAREKQFTIYYSRSKKVQKLDLRYLKLLL